MTVKANYFHVENPSSKVTTGFECTSWGTKWCINVDHNAGPASILVTAKGSYSLGNICINSKKVQSALFPIAASCYNCRHKRDDVLNILSPHPRCIKFGKIEATVEDFPICHLYKEK